MGKTFVSIAVVGLVILILGAISLQPNFLPQNSDTKPMRQMFQLSPKPVENSDSDSNSNQNSPANFTATFEIYTLGTKRIFTQAMYHRQSEDVFLTNDDPSIVHVQKPNTTWTQFFDTLPFSLNKDCLVTGTGQKFCSNENAKLHFYLNGVESPDALDQIIKPDDHLKIEYS